MSSNVMWPIPSRSDIYWEQTPRPLAGITKESSTTVSELLVKNDENWHIFFNDMGFHNHLSHHLLAAWAIGATPAVLTEAYDNHTGILRKLYDSPEKITDDNWTKHLQDAKYYKAYRDFFAEKLAEPDSIGPTLEKYVFSHDANFGPGSPKMFAAFNSGLLHPLIHCGHVEFGGIGMMAQGLALTAITKGAAAPLFPEAFFKDSASDLSAQLAKTSLGKVRSHIATIKPAGEHSFSIVAQMLKDERLGPSQLDRKSDSPYQETVKKMGDIIVEYAARWDVPSDLDSVKEKIEELQWLSVMVFGLGGWREGHPFRSDFFLMHIVTSSIFLPTLAAHLTPKSQALLLKGHFTMLLSWWVSRGRPGLPIQAFFKNVTDKPAPKELLDSFPKPSKSTLGKADVPVSNPWLNIIQSVQHHPDEHLIKTIRALYQYAELYGRREKGEILKGVGTGLEGEAELDGSLFVRVAGNAMDALGWVREGQSDEGREYDRAGLGWDEVWDKSHSGDLPITG